MQHIIFNVGGTRFEGYAYRGDCASGYQVDRASGDVVYTTHPVGHRISDMVFETNVINKIRTIGS